MKCEYPQLDEAYKFVEKFATEKEMDWLKDYLYHAQEYELAMDEIIGIIINHKRALPVKIYDGLKNIGESWMEANLIKEKTWEKLLPIVAKD